ncbi:MAG: DNA-binding protein [Daejeonella sp.]|nr:DNA-binding protein [Daejeonella sp.]
MEPLTFEQLPLAISQLQEKINNIETLLTTRIEKKQEDEIFTISQAADFLNLSVATLYGKVCHKEIPVNKQGKRLYFYKAELTEWIKSGRKKTNSEIEAEASNYWAKRKAQRI